jgi:hypothetical protein
MPMRGDCQIVDHTARSEFDSEFRAKDRVMIDADRSLVGTVTAFSFRPGTRGGINALVEVSFVHNGESRTAWIEETRLTRVLDARYPQ